MNDMFSCSLLLLHVTSSDRSHLGFTAVTSVNPNGRSPSRFVRLQVNCHKHESVVSLRIVLQNGIIRQKYLFLCHDKIKPYQVDGVFLYVFNLPGSLKIYVFIYLFVL
jgi:hypothetical protein